MDTFNKTLLVCWFGIFTTSMGLSQLAPILPLYIRSLGVSEYESVAFYSGLSFGITSLFMAAFSPIWGALTLRFGCKIMLLRASFGMAVLTLTLAFVQNVEQIVIIRALTGVISGFTSSAIVYIALISPAQKAGASLATLSTASVSGNLIGPLFGGVFSDFIGIRALFIVIAGLLFCSFFTIYFFIHEQKGQIKEQIAEEKGFKFFLRDANCVEKADAVMFIGTREQPQGLNCAYCGAATCDQRAAGTPCAINSIDVGIALGSACSKAADLRIDTRVVYSAGTAAQRLGVLGEAKQVLAILMSISSKNPFFDRPKPQ